MRDRKWFLYAVLVVGLLIVVGLGAVTAGGPSKITSFLSFDAADCNAVVSMSQGGQVYSGSNAGLQSGDESELEEMTGEQWMLLGAAGKTIVYFTQPANWNSFIERNRCGTDAEIDRVVFIYDSRESGFDNGSHLTANLDLVAAIVNDRYPGAEFVPTLLVGADGHVVCPVNGKTASRTHRDRIDVALAYPNAGPDLDIPCNLFIDPLGHLTDAGAADAQAQLGAFLFEAPTTTTTEPPTTTTGASTTTTTQAPIPQAGERYIIMLRGMIEGRQEFWWDASYFRSLNYAPNTGWVDGDREQYRCAYGFLQSDGVLVGRVSFFTIPDAGPYTMVNDKFMGEAQRYYDGRPANPALIELHDCQDHFSGLDYQPYAGPSQLPTVVYNLDGKAIEFRNYKPLITGPNITFQVVAANDQLVGVAAYRDTLPAIVVYYESLVPNLIMETDLGFEGG